MNDQLKKLFPPKCAERTEIHRISSYDFITDKELSAIRDKSIRAQALDKSIRAQALDKNIRAQAFWQKMKIQIAKRKDFTQRRECPKSIAKKPLRILCVFATLRALLIFFFWFRLVRVRQIKLSKGILPS